MNRATLAIAPVLAGAISAAEDFSGHRMLVISMCTGGTEVFIVDPETGDTLNLKRSEGS